MRKEDLIRIEKFCSHHNIEVSFINSLHECGLIEITVIGQETFICTDHLPQIEKMMRLYYDMGVNFEGIETITHLLQKVSDMQQEIIVLKNKLQLHLSQ